MNWESVNEFLGKEFTIGDHVIVMGGLIFAVLILIGTYITARVLRRIIVKPRFIIDKIDSRRRMSIFLIFKYIGWVFAIFAALKVIGFDITLLLFGSTAVLVGLGLGLQNIFKDVVSGMFLLFEGSLKIGDIIEADGVIGKVLEINLRSSEILTRDDVKMIIPNSKFVAEKVVNWSLDNENVRFQITVNLAYGSDVEKVIDTLEQVMKENKQVAQTPKPFVRFTDFGESALKFEMIFWSTETFVIDNIKSDLRRSVYKKLKENNLHIPFPQRDVHIKGLDQIKDLKT